MERSRSTTKIIRNAGIAFVLGTSLFGTPSFAQKEGLARETLEQLVSVSPGDLSDSDLALRIQLNRRLLNDNVSEIGGIKLRNLLRADRREMRKRGQSEDAQQEAAAETPAEEPQAAEEDAATKKQNNRQRKRAERRAAEEKAAQENAAQAAAERQQQEAADAQAAADNAAAEQAAAEQAAANQAAADQAAANEAAAEDEARRAAEQQHSNQQPRANRQARKSLQDKRASAKMNVAQLRKRISETEDILQKNELRRALKRSLNDRVNADRAALENKLAIRQERRDDKQANRRDKRQERQDNKNERRADNQFARQLLEDQRRAPQLGLPELRERVHRTRDALQAENMGQKLNKRLLARLSEDRDELRNRVSQREGRAKDRGAREQVLENRNARNELLSDRRPSRRLDDAQLDRRIEQTTSLMDSGRIRPAVRANLERMLRSDRAEKRERLLQARDDRRRKLRRQARQPRDFSVQLGQSGISFNLDIVAAEEDNETIQRQLLAPPRREIRRQYSLNEFRQRPELRDFMPGIELDTIRFGSNEAFIREEEVSNLDAIGEIIEEVVYSQPGEVFLIEGHTDAVGSDGYNYALSEERALAVKEALLDYFNIPEESLVAIGYGERYLRIPTPFGEQENRRVSVRRITPLLSSN